MATGARAQQKQVRPLFTNGERCKQHFRRQSLPRVLHGERQSEAPRGALHDLGPSLVGLHPCEGVGGLGQLKLLLGGVTLCSKALDLLCTGSSRCRSLELPLNNRPGNTGSGNGLLGAIAFRDSGPVRGLKSCRHPADV